MVYCVSIKQDSPCWPRQSKPSLKLLDCGRKIHIDTYRKPEQTITVFHTHFLSPTDEKCAESSTYWQFFYYRPPDKFRFTHLGEIFKMLYIYRYICIYIYDALDNRSGFSISVQPGIDCTTFHSSFSWNVWKNFFFKFSNVGRSVISWRSG